MDGGAGLLCDAAGRWNQREPCRPPVEVRLSPGDQRRCRLTGPDCAPIPQPHNPTDVLAGYYCPAGQDVPGSLAGSFAAAHPFNIVTFNWTTALNLAALATLTALGKGLLARGSAPAPSTSPSSASASDAPTDSATSHSSAPDSSTPDGSAQTSGPGPSQLRPTPPTPRRCRRKPIWRQ